MSSCSALLSAEVGGLNEQSAPPADANLSNSSEQPLEHKENEDKDDDEDEEEDVDFNPFLKETPSLEASSSLSSEIEGLDTDVVDSGADLVTDLSSKAPHQGQDFAVGDSEHGEEIVMQTAVSPGGACRIGSENTSVGFKERKSVLVSEPENATFCEKENGSRIRTDAINADMVGVFDNTTQSRKPIMDINEEDAICMRTRARYSLASFTLDELETFLQETDDDDDLQNVDDEEEYRKFLAAVLQGGDSDQKIKENENVDDEDEENDADFELEIEEALESDLDENIRGEMHGQEYKAAGRRPETRQNRHQKASVQHKKKISGQLNRPLRPLLPNAPIATFPAFDGKNLMPEIPPHCLSSSAHNGFVNGFTPHQIGQLHCLIHEHAQLLIQVFSLCVFEPSRQHIASQVQGLISEMLHKRDQVLAWRRIPYPSYCFCPPYIHSSVPDELPKILPVRCTSESSSISDAHRSCFPGNSVLRPYDLISPSKGRYEYVSNGQVSCLQAAEGLHWVPFSNGPVLSVMDVAPLNFVGSYMDDICTAVREYQRRHVGVTCDTRFERVPLFPFHNFQSIAEDGEVSREAVAPASNLTSSFSASDQTPRKTMAAALVERTKKQSVAPVPKEIAKLAKRFFPLFNSALFPHKPPPAAVVNRVLFTDAEDELLAMGLMEYNTDWKAIQQRFLPCKSKHQIFVRQKNRSSSKAPENPIKAVRRMKTSPLTAEEKTRIEEGLKVFKLDWMSVWKFVVPHRDPSLLPRQWRIATGTQKSYKADADKREKRRLYESKRRKCKSAALACWQTLSEKEDCSTDNAGGENISGDDCVDNEGEAYVHEAFLADWRAGASSIPPRLLVSTQVGKPPLTPLLSQQISHVREQRNNNVSGDSEPQIGHKFPSALRQSHHTQAPSHFTLARHCPSSTDLNLPVSDMTLRSSNSQSSSQQDQAHRTNSVHLVKLAPDLPPVNLPPSVRVMSQSAFKNCKGVTSIRVPCADAGFGGPATANIVSKLPHVVMSGTSNPVKARQNKSDPQKCSTTNLHPQDSGGLKDKHVAEEKEESDLQMHPLLFQAPEDGQLPYYPLNCSTSASSFFNLFSRNQPQLNLSLFHNPHQADHTLNFVDKSLRSKERSLSSYGIDFHPLLQRNDDVSSHLETAHSVAQLSATSELLSGQCPQLQNSFDAVPTKSRVNSSAMATFAIPSSPNGKTNELDLEIHLSFASRKDKAVGSRDVTEDNLVRSTVSAQDSGTVENENITNSLYQRSEYSPKASLPDRTGNKLDSGAQTVVTPSNNINRNTVNNIGDQSLPEIVMEQEELSDSEEEVGEHVEFECEEMADSEGDEESDTEQIVNIQNKEVPDVAVEKVARDSDNQQHKGRNHDNSEGNFCGPSESKNYKLGLVDQEKENSSSSLCLGLNSCAPVSPAMKTNQAVSRNLRVSAGKRGTPSHSNKSCKKTTLSANYVTAQNNVVEMQQQSTQDSLAATQLRKPRKRASKTDSSLNTGQQKKRNLSVSTNVTVETSKSVGEDQFG